MSANPDNPAFPTSIRDLSVSTMERIAREIPASRVITGIQQLMDARIGEPPAEGETDTRRPDLRAVEAGVKLWLSYVIGLPVQRQEIVTHKISSAPALKTLLADPAVKAQILAEIRAMESETERPPIDANRGLDAGLLPVSPVAEKGNGVKR